MLKVVNQHVVSQVDFFSSPSYFTNYIGYCTSQLRISKCHGLSKPLLITNAAIN